MRILKEVTVEVTQKCNSLCIFCSSLSNSFCSNEIPLQKLKDISQFSYLKGAKRVNVSGGEPLLRNDLAEFLSFNESIGLSTSIYTSGNIEDQNKFTDILNGIALNSSVNFIFNYPSADKFVFQKLINSTDFEPCKIDSHISLLLAKGVNVETHIVPNAININSLYETIVHLKQMGVKQVSLLRLVLQGRAEANKALLTNTDFTAKLKLVISRIISDLADETFNIRLGVPFRKEANNDCECFAGINKLIFRYDGTVFPCEAFKEASGNSEFVLGNIYKDSLESIWNNHPVHCRLAQLKSAAIQVAETCPAQLLY